MALFGKKDREKETCPICGKEMKFFSSEPVKDGTICGDCAKMLRGVYDVEHWMELRSDGSAWRKQHDTLRDVTVAELRSCIAEARQQQAETVGALGQDYASLFRVEEVFTIAPKPLEVGLKRSKELRDKTVAKGLVLSGSFKKGDPVEVLHDGQKSETSLLAVYQCTGTSDFQTELGANMCRSAEADGHAWLILADAGAAVGDTIGAK